MKKPQHCVLARMAPLILSLALAGCAVGPDYLRPATVAEALPAQWRARAGEPDLQDWWARFEDPVLVELIEGARQTSPSLEEAAGRLQQARGAAGVSAAAGLPTLTLQGQPFAKADAGSAKPTVTQSGGIAVAWELDIFGAARRDKEATGAKLLGAAYALKHAHVALAADVATAYFARRSCEAQLRLALADLEARRLTLRLTERKYAVGAVSSSDIARTTASVAEGQSAVRGLEGTCERTLNQLAALTGLPLATLDTRLTAPARLLPAPPMAPYVPAALLSRRADVRNAEAQLMAASANVGVAAADMLPRLTLTGVLSSVAMGPAGSARAAIETWSFASSLTAPLWDNGKRSNAVTVAEGRYLELAGTYRAQVRTAVKEVEDALSRVQAAQAQQGLTEQSEAAYAKHFQALSLRYSHGVSSLLEQEDARRTYINARLNNLNTRIEHLQAQVALYRALGGSWVDVVSGQENS